MEYGVGDLSMLRKGSCGTATFDILIYFFIGHVKITMLEEQEQHISLHFNESFAQYLDSILSLK